MLAALMAAVAVFAAAGCSDSGGTDRHDAVGELKVATSIPPIQSLVSAVAGDRAEVSSIVPAGMDGHTYEPTPGDVRMLAAAAVVFLPDADLNPKLTRLARQNIAEDALLVDVNALVVPDDEAIFSDMHSHGDGVVHGHDRNPHTWTNMAYVPAMVDEITAALSAADPGGEDTYAANRDALNAEIAEFTAAAQTALATVPAENRTLVVYHDSWSYFGREYGFDVQGALQAVDFAEPSAAEMRTMVRQVQAAGVPAFFGSEVFPTAVLEQVSRESGVDYVGNLSDDQLPGAAGDAEHTYLGMMAANVRLIVEGLGGDASALDAVDPARE
ncbi:metal ABC transporter substrate-binding protein [Mycobacterium sp. SMC-4]|uniref:metal ABC transporter substrate-binding protein n=1 Tax=Mycobacterium sp. SMC-4 TaxID=2857059 RepID=UPI0021B33CB9|nr:metal ABC transporter substrate-binding protein [Mycobacterium sp. SMC-4]UXA17735.1 metal ABC transporter substrate-binding protein [Mycobacterium sp. SMC-4]